MRVVVNKNNAVTALFNDLELTSIKNAAAEVVKNAKANGTTPVSPLATHPMTEEELYNTAVTSVCRIVSEQLAEECFIFPNEEI